jgi:hypothetical protein
MITIRDWYRVFLSFLAVWMAFAVPIILALSSGRSALAMVIVVAFIVAVLRLIADIQGISISRDSDFVKFPYYLWRTKIKLREIADINMEYADHPLLALAFANRQKSRAAKTYNANLSGDFGRRRIRFFTKGARDEFLSVMRKYSNAKITRWS